MNARRKLLALIALAPFAARAQPAAKPAPRLFRVGMLESTSQTLNRANYEAFREGLRDLSYIEGQNLIIDYRSADGRAERFADFVTDLVRLKADVIVARGTPAVLAAKLAAPIPVVMTGVGDPVGLKIVASLAHPGGHITGLTTRMRDLTLRRLELLKEVAPRITRVGSLLNMSNPAGVTQWKEFEAAARALGLHAVLLDVREPQDFAPAFEAAEKQRAGALLVNLDALIAEHRRAVAEFAAKHRLPAIYADSEFVLAGGLMSYGVHYPHLYYRAAGYVDRILKGARPAELPVGQPNHFLLVVNQRAARTLKLVLPPALLQRADRVIG